MKAETKVISLDAYRLGRKFGEWRFAGRADGWRMPYEEWLAHEQSLKAKARKRRWLAKLLKQSYLSHPDCHNHYRSYTVADWRNLADDSLGCYPQLDKLAGLSPEYRRHLTIY